MSFENFKKYQILLASKSPRRQYLLKELGLNFEVRTKDVDESFPSNLIAQEIPIFLCEKKANAFDEDLNDNTSVITADTIVWLPETSEVLNKPENFDDAVRMLQLLSGKMHEVYTAVCLKSKHKTKSFYALTKVYFKPLSLQEIEFYVNTCQPYDKAGSYGAQECLPSEMNPCSQEEIDFLTHLNKTHIIKESRSEIKDRMEFSAIDKVDGSYFNVMGLPIKELYEELLNF